MNWKILLPPLAALTLRTRSGETVDLTWRNGRLTRLRRYGL